MLPVTAAEMDVKLREGIDGLLERLEEAFEMPYGPIDPPRPSVV